MSESSKRRRDQTNLEQAVSYFINVTGSERVKIKGNINLQLSLETIQEWSKSRGLSPEHIEKLVDAAANVNGRFPETVCTKLIRALIPATVVPEHAVIKVISHMCTNKPSINLQSLFLRWILLIYDFIDKLENLHKVYGIIFFFLESQILCPHVCHLLYLLTRKEDVKMFRVRRLLMLQAKLGSQPYLTGLLAIYKLYYPNLVTVVLSKRKRLFFPQHDRQWSAMIQKVQDENRVQDNSSFLQNRAEQSLLRAEPRNKKRKLDHIPIVHSYGSTESVMPRETILSSLEQSKVPFVQIKDLKDMLENANRIELPSQIGAVLKSSVLQHYLSYTRDQVAASRFSYWLYATLSDELLDNRPGTDEEDRVKELLVRVAHFTDFVQEGLPVLDHFLSKFLKSWDGLDYRTQILHLVTRYRLSSFSKLNADVLEPLRKLFICSSVYFKCQVIHCLTVLLQNYAGCEWQRYMEWNEIQSEEMTNSIEEKKSCFSMLFQEDREIFDAQATITELIDYVCKLCIQGLQLEENHNLLLHCALNFYEEVSNLHLRYNLPFTCVTKTLAFVVPFFSQNAMGISRLCSILCNYKDTFNSLKEKKIAGELPESDLDGSSNINAINMVLLDVSNALWKSQLFTAKHDSTFFNFDPHSLVKSLPVTEDLFMVYMHPGLIGYTLKFLKETQPEDNIGHPRAVKPVKKLFLQFLEREGVYGVADFIYTFLSKMKQTRKSTVESTIIPTQ